MRIAVVVCGTVALTVALASLTSMSPGAPGAGVARAAAVSSATDASGKTSAPCTKRALETAMRHAQSHARIARKNAFGCSGGFAYAFAIAGSGPAAFEENLLFRASGRRWKVVSRAKYCNKPVVPARIKKAVCFSS